MKVRGVQEYLHDPVLRLSELARNQSNRTVIGLSGVPGSGKSTLATEWQQRISRELGTDSVVVLGMDGFHLTRAQLRAMPDPDEAFRRRGAPWTFNPDALAGKLAELHTAYSRYPVTWPGFDHGVGDPIPDEVTVQPKTPLILVEGIYVAQTDGPWQAVSRQIDEQWYLDVSWEEARPWLIARHMAAWSMTREEAATRADANDKINARLVEAARRHASYLVTRES